MAAPSYSGPSPIVPRCLWIVLYPVQNPEWPSSGTSNFCGPYFIVQTFSWRRCKATEAGYCEILYWNLQTSLTVSEQWKTGTLCLSPSCQPAL